MDDFEGDEEDGNTPGVRSPLHTRSAVVGRPVAPLTPPAAGQRLCASARLRAGHGQHRGDRGPGLPPPCVSPRRARRLSPLSRLAPFHTSAPGSERPEVWFQDLSCAWNYLAPRFSAYFRVMLHHLGLPSWQYAFTEAGLDPLTRVRRRQPRVFPRSTDSRSHPARSGSACCTRSGCTSTRCSSPPRSARTAQPTSQRAPASAARSWPTCRWRAPLSATTPLSPAWPLARGRRGPSRWLPAEHRLRPWPRSAPGRRTRAAAVARGAQRLRPRPRGKVVRRQWTFASSIRRWRRAAPRQQRRERATAAGRAVQASWARRPRLVRPPGGTTTAAHGCERRGTGPPPPPSPPPRAAWPMWPPPTAARAAPGTRRPPSAAGGRRGRRPAAHEAALRARRGSGPRAGGTLAPPVAAGRPPHPPTGSAPSPLRRLGNGESAHSRIIAFLSF